MRHEATKPSALASVVLALALTGDALLYAILPLEAATFGITLAGAGVLLSVNRLVRLVLFGRLASAAARFGLRAMTVWAAALGAASTIAVALGSGMLLLSGARVAWGVAFGALAMTTLGYATATTDGAGARLGLSLSIREAGPLVACTAGVGLAATLGPREALLILGGVSLLAVPIAVRLPDTKLRGSESAEAPGAPVETRPSITRGESISFVTGLVVDGVFVTTIGLHVAGHRGPDGAAAFAATALAGRRLATLTLAPVAGRIGDSIGAGRALAASLFVAATGLAAIGAGRMTGGVVLLVAAAAFPPTVLPMLDPGSGHAERLRLLARLNASRDLGATIGPLAGVVLLDTLGGGRLYLLSCILVLICAVVGVTPGESKRLAILGDHSPSTSRSPTSSRAI